MECSERRDSSSSSFGASRRRYANTSSNMLRYNTIVDRAISDNLLHYLDYVHPDGTGSLGSG
eukprot:1313015-Amorphochlora_amoeboformis.AAC.1